MKFKTSSYSRYMVLFVAIAFSWHTSTAQTATDQQAPSGLIKIDGDATDWQGWALSENKDTKLLYAVTNDANGINLLLKSGDAAQQMKMFKGGVQILVDVKGKKKKGTGINFPLPGNAQQTAMGQRTSQRADASAAPQKPDIKRLHQQMLLQQTEMELFGFSEEADGLTSVNFSPVKVAINWNGEDSMVYEMHIPYAAFAKPPKPDDKISIGVIIKGMKQPGMNNDDRGAGPRGRGFGGGPGGGRPGGFGGGAGRPGGGTFDRGDMEKMFQDTNFWIKYTLSH
jgi:hypothetical protein